MMRQVRFFLLLAMLVACDETSNPLAESTQDASGEGFDASTAPPEDASTQMPDATAPPRCDIGERPSAEAVPTTEGWIVGREENNARVFEGIPFAQPPLEDLRLRAPQAPACRDEVLKADSRGFSCVQPASTMSLFFSQETSEDCLRLNVWTPIKASETPRKVMVFIYGGMNAYGSTNDGYHGVDFVNEHDVVFVTLNYRIGPLAFLAHPALSEEDENGSSGNLALQDQLAALNWVNQNIANFGGDPNHVMVFGESAGAYNTCALMTSPLAKGLFNSALMQSGACGAISREEAYSRGAEEVSELGCDNRSNSDTLECLRSLSTEKFKEVVNFGIEDMGGGRAWRDLPYVLNVDGWSLREDPLDAIRAGRHSKMRMIIGTNRDETELMTPVDYVSCGGYERLINGYFDDPDLHAEILRRYPCPGFGKVRGGIVELSTDVMFNCPNRRLLRALQANQEQPIWRYLYTFTRHDLVFAPLKAFHGSELLLLFGTYDTPTHSPTDGEKDLELTLRGAWAGFAQTGSPTSFIPSWEKYDVQRDNMLKIDASRKNVELGLIEDYRHEQCDFWDAVYENGGKLPSEL